jgi:hypothetical protein
MTRRRRITYTGVSNRAIGLYRYALTLRQDSDLFRKVDTELSRELAIKVWEPSIFELEPSDDVPDDMPPDHVMYYVRVRDLRRALAGAPSGGRR